jgi:hypothetical protein
MYDIPDTAGMLRTLGEWIETLKQVQGDKLKFAQ